MATLDSILKETRVFEPSEEFRRKATISGMDAYNRLCDQANEHYAGFWGELARERISWKKMFTRVLDESNPPFFKWFDDGELNVSYNCIDRHLAQLAHKIALIFEADDGAVTRVTYAELYRRVCQFANGLKSLGVQKGDRIVSVNGEVIKDWEHLKKVVGAHPGEKIDIEVERNGERSHVFPMPMDNGEAKGKIMVGPYTTIQPVGVAEAALLSVTEPPKVVYNLVKGLARMIAGKEKPELSGPVGIVKETASAAKSGAHQYLKLLGALSAYLGGFNLLPLPALDGGRLLFLLFEAASRRRADAKIEAKVHAIGLLMFLTLIAFVTYTEVR